VASKRADARQNREHLVSVARAMAESGDVPSFNALAREAGVGVGTVYRHFEDEHALASAIVAERVDAFRELVQEARALESPAAAFERFLHGSIDLVMDEHLVANVLARAPDILRAVQADADFILERAKRAKVLRKDFSLGDVRRLVCGIERAARSGDNPREAAERYLQILLAGLRPAAARYPNRTL
jgi:AcrR family transcriptional regulator